MLQNLYLLSLDLLVDYPCPLPPFTPWLLFLNRPMREALWGQIKASSELPYDGKEISKNGSKELALLQAQN